jgi:hypothetical protein
VAQGKHIDGGRCATAGRPAPRLWGCYRGVRARASAYPDVITGTAGARKRRFAGRGKGKSGGYRVVSYYADNDVPVLLLALVDKGERADLSQAGRRLDAGRLLRICSSSLLKNSEMDR